VSSETANTGGGAWCVKRFQSSPYSHLQSSLNLQGEISSANGHQGLRRGRPPCFPTRPTARVPRPRRRSETRLCGAYRAKQDHPIKTGPQQPRRGCFGPHRDTPTEPRTADPHHICHSWHCLFPLSSLSRSLSPPPSPLFSLKRSKFKQTGPKQPGGAVVVQF
jgi:hypothetical protein